MDRGAARYAASLAGDAGAVLYDSGRVTLLGGDDLTLAAVPNTNGGGAALSLAGLSGSGSFEVADTNVPTGLRVGHLSPDTPDVDIVVDGGITA